MNQQEYYKANGYVVCPNLVPVEAIDRLLNFYKGKILPSKYPFFRQNTNKYETNELNEFGHVKQAFLDIHDYQQHPEFSRIAKEIFFDKNLHEKLKEITGSSAFNLMQTMLFDANAETQSHQDWWYLDTVPNGHLLAAWIALEDINEKAGRFYVIPKSNNLNFHSDAPNLSHSEWIERIEQYVDKNRAQIQAPELKKGDVLFWNSRTIHGSLPTADTSFSRKSLTAHYLPSEYKFGNLFTTKDYIKYRTYNGMKFYRNQPDYSLVNKFKSNIKFGVYNSPQLIKIMRWFQAKLQT